jgi:hypothetical protein
MGEWHSTSRAINQPLRVFLSLTLSDFFTLLFVFGVLQLVLFLSGIEPVITLMILAVLTAALVVFRYKHPKDQLRDYVLYSLWKTRGGVIYEPTIEVRQKYSGAKLLGPQ